MLNIDIYSHLSLKQICLYSQLYAGICTVVACILPRAVFPQRFLFPFAHTPIPCNRDQHQLQSLWPPLHPCAVKWWILIKISQGILQSLKVTFVLLHLLPSLNKYSKLDDSSRRFYSDTSSIHFPALLNHKALDSFPGIRSKISSGYIDHSTNCIMKAALHQSSSKSLLSLDFAWLLLQSILEQFKSLMINPQGFFKVLFL